jgi:hypothetical protein
MKDSFELRTGVKWNEIQKIMRVKWINITGDLMKV